MSSLEVNLLMRAAADACDSRKAEDIRILALDQSESALTDYFLICSGTNERQNVAISDEIEARLKKEFETLPNSVEGRRQGEWVLMDYVDFVVHIFMPERREYYGLEQLRKSAKSLSLDDLNVEIKTAIEAARTRTPTPKKATEQGDSEETVPVRQATKAPAKRSRKSVLVSEVDAQSTEAATTATRVGRKSATSKPGTGPAKPTATKVSRPRKATPTNA